MRRRQLSAQRAKANRIGCAAAGGSPPPFHGGSRAQPVDLTHRVSDSPRRHRASSWLLERLGGTVFEPRRRPLPGIDSVVAPVGLLFPMALVEHRAAVL